MRTPPPPVASFLAHRAIAVAGVSRDSRSPANLIYRRLRDEGYRVFPVNPRTSRVEDNQHCWRSLADIPEPVDGVIAVTPPAQSEALVRDCARLGIPRLWMHRALGTGSVSPAAVEYGRSHGVDVLVGGCPLMYCGKVDRLHGCFRWVLGRLGRLPEEPSRR